ncbi:FYDLN acid domain-containing protein [Paracoccus sp. 1_MG-2023]|uniref:FYDLN acid domain-containing protein n=1 Tax=unclassified Paracoccus (in: a-proteobacteria) TaxID=2688777 RepID=UPI001C092E55|nr:MULTISPECIES: FYDLN acid domain-containing protein [unclassified Paracoccus (in: a-proteobacteria)]MBU2958367.1 FYDLN acid domain-containing protein [Paracoccus sp. C2R09]MDO6670286.1 FYDLN acid domain-containing protein [Paracoccus sp. 1_MG-2023]
MPKEEWGTKRLCPHCATRFYDLQKDPMTCPACGNQFSLDSLTDGRGKTIATKEAPNRGRAADNSDDEDEVSNDNGDLDDDLLDDDDDSDDVSLDDIADVADDDED